MRIAIIGCGWLGIPLSSELIRQGYVVNGSTTSSEKMNALRKKGIIPYLIHVDDTLTGNYEGFFDVDQLIINIPPGRRKPNVVQSHPIQIRLLVEQAKSHKIKHIIFVSSTGVYKDTRQLINEEGPCIPTRSSGQALLRAESVIRASGIKWTIIRLAGLVGEERQPGKWFAGKMDVPFGDNPVNMIHRDDCIAAIASIVNNVPTNDIYNLCSGEHPLKRDFYKAQAIKSGEEPPQFNEGIGPHKIVDNSKFKKKFKFKYKFPDPVTF